MKYGPCFDDQRTQGTSSYIHAKALGNDENHK